LGFANSGSCSLETLLAKPKFQGRLLLARHLIFVGLESFLNAPKPARDKVACGHDWLTECRAEEMATRVRNAFPDSAPNEPTYWALDIGHAQTKSQSLEWDQRRAVILGVRNRKNGLSVEDAIARISTQTRVEEVRFADYSKISTAKPDEIRWGPGTGGTGHR